MNWNVDFFLLCVADFPISRPWTRRTARPTDERDWLILMEFILIFLRVPHSKSMELFFIFLLIAKMCSPPPHEMLYMKRIYVCMPCLDSCWQASYLRKTSTSSQYIDSPKIWRLGKSFPTSTIHNTNWYVSVYCKRQGSSQSGGRVTSSATHDSQSGPRLRNS